MGRTLKTHFHLSAQQISRIDYDYNGPAGCQRKFVYTAEGVFVYHQIENEWRIAENRSLYTREQAQAFYRRVRKWADRAHARLRAEILVPVFGGDACVMHNSMMAAAEGKPWPCLMARYPDYHRLGRRYEFQERMIYQTSERLSSHFARFF